MENIHGVDVSWLHHSNQRDRTSRLHASHAAKAPPDTPAPVISVSEDQQPTQVVESTTPNPPSQTNGTSHPAPVQPPSAAPKSLPKRPTLLSRGSSERTLQPQADNQKTPQRRGSWISNISSKFSSNAAHSASNPPTVNAQPNGAPSQTPNGTSQLKPEVPPKGIKASAEQLEPYVPHPPKPSGSSFFSNALRRLSANSQSGTAKAAIQGGAVCPRKVMNIDPNRPRCLVPELDQNKLRRVAFCVDVEIAGGPRYKDDTDHLEKSKKFKEKKLKERGEGEALKHPNQVAEEKEKTGALPESQEANCTETAPDSEAATSDEKKDVSRKKEKKKKSEEERKARKEEKRRKAEESGSIPIQTQPEAEGLNGSPPLSATPPAAPAPSPPRHTDRPTTDPLRIYRRCCQLRESPVLKRISEQLAAPDTSPLATPGVVSTLDLTGSRLQLTDFVTLSDWLAIVPVKKLVLEDAELTDEAVRVTLAGLLAARSADSSRRRTQGVSASSGTKHEERSGIIEKLNLKNNPKVTAEGWKHIALFIYMCKSLKGLDVSMIPFPHASTVESTPTPIAADPGATPIDPKKSLDMADIFSKAVSERLGGRVLEELVMGECQLTAEDIRKIIDGVIKSGVKKLGLASNRIGDDALEHVIRYAQSGVCEGLDLGGNDMRDSLTRLCESFTSTVPLWALSLADCNLDPKSLRPLFPALIKLPNLRFLDLSHNHELFESQPSAVALLRKYLPQLPILKRIHLKDVAMTPAQAIAIAEILPECTHLAHINILENPKLSALAAATEEEAQEEACALYASLMAATRVSRSIICIDIEKPSTGNSEIVKALAKQVIAYSLRNLEYATQSDHADVPNGVAASLEHDVREIEVPDVLLHLVGQSEGHFDPHPEVPAPDNDYIVGGTGVVKALNYCLSENAMDMRRSSLTNSGTATPREQAFAQDMGATRAKNMSKSLLDSAKKIRERLRPALVREDAKAGNEMGYRRLVFLDNTLQGIIQRFEDEFPEVRSEPVPALPKETSTVSSASADTLGTSPTGKETASVIPLLDEDTDDEEKMQARLHSRHNSDVSLAAKALSIEEGQLHRLGQKLKRDLWGKTVPEAVAEDENDGYNDNDNDEPEHLKVLREKLEALDADVLRDCVRRDGVEGVLQHLGERAEHYRQLQLEKPEELAEFRKMLRDKTHSGEGVEAASSAIEDDEQQQPERP